MLASETIISCAVGHVTVGDVAVESAHQWIGIPIARLKPLAEVKDRTGISGSSSRHARGTDAKSWTPGHINFVRSRLLYARAAFNARGQVRYGLPHIRRLAQHWSTFRLAS